MRDYPATAQQTGQGFADAAAAAENAAHRLYVDIDTEGPNKAGWFAFAGRCRELESLCLRAAEEAPE